ncbi:MAG: pseudouridine synthase, partial [bacterium]
MKYETIQENEEFIIINKPAGLLVHGANHLEEETLADLLLEKYPEIKKVGDDPIRPGIVHRLDKLASGLMVVARTQKSFDNLKEQFQKRTVKKYYTALVYGQIAKDKDEINFPILRSSKGYK